MDYRVVRGNLMRMWRVYDIEDITKTNSGVFYFKFKSEDGMKKVLESGPWMVQNVPLVLNVWEPGIWLEKTEPSIIPIWVCVYNIPMELCNGNGIGKIMSGVGKPLLMDNMTKDRCLKKSGKLDFARVLVEVSADVDLPCSLEIAYPPIGNRPAKVGVLDVKYQWKPPLCTHCKTFGHSTLACKVRPRTEEEVAAKNLKDMLNVGKSDGDDRGKSVIDEDGFTVVGKKNKPVLSQTNLVQRRGGGQNRWDGKVQGNGRQGYGSFGGGNFNFNGQRRFSGGGQRNQVQQKSGIKTSNVGGNVKFGVKNGIGSNVSDQGNKKDPIVVKPVLASSYNQNFRPKVLVRGSGSVCMDKSSVVEDVPVKNSFQVLDDQIMKDKEECVLESMEEEYNNELWPKLKQDVIDVMETRIYPAWNVRAEWSLAQMNFFYNNCHRYGLDPSYEDDDDVATEDGDMAKEMRAEDVVLEARSCDIRGDPNVENVSNV
ncbi:RNA-directed DNA polymerase, eukaryota, reverse transcriptase zinc-binding domain protein [Tanacetum coccineum]